MSDPRVISLSDLNQLGNTAPSRRQALVNGYAARLDEPFDPALWYWRRLHTGIARIARGDPHGDVRRYLTCGQKPDRAANFEAGLDSLLDWVTAEQVQFLPRLIHQRWIHDGLEVRLAPELHCQVAGERHVIKLHLKKHERIQLDDVRPGIAALEAVHGPKGAYLDLFGNTLVSAPRPMSTRRIEALAAEAQRMWPNAA